jgi:protocatechuate 3,4-dioxygenase beta subunit
MQTSRSSIPVDVGRLPRRSMSRLGQMLGTFTDWITGDLARPRTCAEQVLPPCCTTGNDPASANRLTSSPETQPPAQRRNLVTPDVDGVLLSLAGQVVDDRRRPVPGAMLEFWQVHESHRYGDPCYLVHGHQHTDAGGGYALETVVPRAYGTRTPHVHVTVITPHAPMIATELFFPDTMHVYGLDIRRLNSRDHHIDRSHTISLGRHAGNQYPASFDFVIGGTAS